MKKSLLLIILLACGFGALQAQFEAQIAQLCDGGSPNEGTILRVTATGAPSGNWNLEIFNTSTVLASGANGDLVDVTGVPIGTTVEVVDGVTNTTVATIINLSGGSTFLNTQDDDTSVEGDNALGCQNEKSYPSFSAFDLVGQGLATAYSAGTPNGIIGSDDLTGQQNGNFNAVIFGSFISDGTGDSEGRLAVEGNLEASMNYTIGGGAPTSTGGLHAPQGWDNLVVGGDVNHSSTFAGTRGNVLYNTATALPPFSGGFSTVPGMYRQGMPAINWAAAKTFYQTLSADLSACSMGNVTGPVNTAGGQVDIDLMNNTGLVIVNLASWNSNTVYNFQNAGAADAIIVNVPDVSIVIQGGVTIQLDGVGISFPISGTDLDFVSKTLWNFPNATEIDFNGSLFAGSVLAPSAFANLQGGSINGQTILGNSTRQGGGFEFHNFCFTPDITPCSNNLLPVELTSFTGISQDCNVELKWQTASEMNNSHFEVEHSVNGKQFTTLAKIAGAGTTIEKQNYQFLHESAAPLNYYRLKQVDFDGTSTYTSVISVQTACKKQKAIVNVYPTVAADGVVTVEMSLAQSDIAMLEIFNVYGQRVLQQTVAATATDYIREVVDLTNLSAGQYFLRVTGSNWTSEVKNIIKSEN